MRLRSIIALLARLWGKGYISKSSVIRQAARRYGITVRDARVAPMNPADLKGIPTHGERD